MQNQASKSDFRTFRLNVPEFAFRLSKTRR
jgi:hypothetical protein